MATTRSTVDAPKRRRVGRPGALEWDKEVDALLTVRGSDELPAGVTLSGPTLRIDRLTLGSEPEVWTDVTSDFSIAGKSIADSVADDETTVLGTDQAIEFLLSADLATLPDVTDEPIPGGEYRVVVTGIRSDAGEWAGKCPLIIHF